MGEGPSSGAQQRGTASDEGFVASHDGQALELRLRAEPAVERVRVVERQRICQFGVCDSDLLIGMTKGPLDD